MTKSDFAGQLEGEEIVSVFKRSIFTLLRPFLACLAIAILGFLPLILVSNNQNLLFLGLAIFVVAAVVFLRYWINWYFSYYLLTNKRLRFTKQKGLFGRNTSEVWLDKVEAATVNVPGFGSTGTVVLQTQAGNMVVARVSRAEQVYDKIQSMINVNNKTKVGKDEKQG